jgi:chemotaxis signal transduction protein
MTARQALLLPVGEDVYALPVEWVLEVVAAPKVTRLITAPPTVLGLFNLRGHIVPILDTAALLGIGAVKSTVFAVVVNCPPGPVGLAVTAFPRRGELDAATGSSELPGTDGLYEIDYQAVSLLDPAALLTADRIGGREFRNDAAHIEVG